MSEAAKALSDAELRDILIRAHGMATGSYVQSADVMRQRIGRLLDSAIERDDLMRGFLGRGGPCAERDILGGGPTAGRLETGTAAAVKGYQAAVGVAEACAETLRSRMLAAAAGASSTVTMDVAALTMQAIDEVIAAMKRSEARVVGAAAEEDVG